MMNRVQLWHATCFQQWNLALAKSVQIIPIQNCTHNDNCNNNNNNDSVMVRVASFQIIKRNEYVK